jgi:hypothetical protein
VPAGIDPPAHRGLHAPPVHRSRVRYVAALADEGMTLVAIRRILELEHEVAPLKAELEAVRRRLAGTADE